MVFNRSIATACMNFSKMALIFTDFPVGNGSKTCALLEICGYQASRRFLSKQEKFQHRLALPYIKYNCAVQWRIQDFPEAGAPIPKLVLFCKFFAKNCMKMKEFDPRERPWCPPCICQCSITFVILLFIYAFKYIFSQTTVVKPQSEAGETLISVIFL